MVVVTDTTPLNYLLLVGQIGLLPRFFGRVLIPAAVWRELNNSETPEVVRSGIASCSSWLDIQYSVEVVDSDLRYLDAGEQEVLTLAVMLGADRVLLDEAEARREAIFRGIPVVGTLGILREGARRSLLDLADVLAALQQTSFFVSPRLIRSLLQEDIERKRREPHL
jgi:predicted nucleic acid-binding protein